MSQSSTMNQQYVLIDIRNQQDSERNGSGIVPRAIPMDTEFLDQPDALTNWLQHVDSIIGCNICIIDLPPGKPISLWRRLILGEGDGFISTNHSLNNIDNDNNSDRNITSIRDLDSRFYEDEEQALDDDKNRHAVKLAHILQNANFSNVSVLEGGFPELVKQLLLLRGSVEPLVINHNQEVWENFLLTSGREKYSLKTPTHQLSRNLFNLRLPVLGVNSNVSSVDTTENCSIDENLKREFDVAQIAYLTAVRLGHEYMSKILEAKLKSMQDKLTDNLGN